MELIKNFRLPIYGWKHSLYFSAHSSWVHSEPTITERTFPIPHLHQQPNHIKRCEIASLWAHVEFTIEKFVHAGISRNAPTTIICQFTKNARARVTHPYCVQVRPAGILLLPCRGQTCGASKLLPPTTRPEKIRNCSQWKLQYST